MIHVNDFMSYHLIGCSKLTIKPKDGWKLNRNGLFGTCSNIKLGKIKAQGLCAILVCKGRGQLRNFTMCKIILKPCWYLSSQT